MLAAPKVRVKRILYFSKCPRRKVSNLLTFSWPKKPRATQAKEAKMNVKQKSNNVFQGARLIEGFTAENGTPLVLSAFQEYALVYLLLNGVQSTRSLAINCRSGGTMKTRKYKTTLGMGELCEAGYLYSFQNASSHNGGGFQWYLSPMGEELACHLLKEPDARIGFLAEQAKTQKRHRFCPTL